MTHSEHEPRLVVGLVFEAVSINDPRRKFIARADGTS